jgi:hypothetical protein
MMKIIKAFTIFAFLLLSTCFAAGPIYDQAIDIENTPAGNISSTNVQAAVNELDSEKQAAGNYFNKTSDDTDDIAEGSTHKFADTTKENNGQTAYGWGNHAGLYSLLNHNHDLIYLSLSATAADSGKLNGQLASYYLHSETDPTYTSWYNSGSPILTTLKYVDANTYITRDGSNNLSFTDANAGTVTLTSLKSMRNIWISAATQSEGNLTLSDGTNWATQYSFISYINVVCASTNWSMWLCETSAFNTGLITTRQIASNINGNATLYINQEYNSDGNNVYIIYTDVAGTATASILISGEARRH